MHFLFFNHCILFFFSFFVRARRPPGHSFHTISGQNVSFLDTGNSLILQLWKKIREHCTFFFPFQKCLEGTFWVRNRSDQFKGHGKLNPSAPHSKVFFIGKERKRCSGLTFSRAVYLDKMSALACTRIFNFCIKWGGNATMRQACVRNLNRRNKVVVLKTNVAI